MHELKIGRKKNQFSEIQSKFLQWNCVGSGGVRLNFNRNFSLEFFYDSILLKTLQAFQEENIVHSVKVWM